jgi:hypothetical protein
VNCPKCGAAVVESGITVRVTETRLYMRESYGSDLVLVATLGRPEIAGIQCRRCLSALPLSVAETLRLDGVAL